MKQRYTFTDSGGLTIATSVPVLVPEGEIPLKLQKYSACKLTLVTTVESGIGPFDPHGPSSYPSASDAAVIAFAGVDGHGTLQVRWPGPVDSIFLGDQETVDPSAISDLITAIHAEGIMPDGLTSIGSYLWGFRRTLTKRKY